MTRSSTKELFTPFKDLKREFRSSRKHFKILSLDESRSPDLDLFSDQEEYSEEKVAETIAKTMEQYMSKTRADYGSGSARPKIEDNDSFELKDQFLKELRDNTFSCSDHKDANKHIEKVLEIVDLFHIPNITINQVMLRAFPIRKGEVHTASVATASTQVSTASTNVATTSISHDTICAYTASQSNGSQIKYEDITQIDEDDIEEIDIKWNMALLSMRADRAPRSQDRGKRESYKQGSKEEEPAPKALMAIDGIGWDWSYMANEEENHALVADDKVPTEFALMAKSSSSSENEVSRDVEIRDNKIEYLMNELEKVKKEKEGLDNKLTGFEFASEDLDNLLGSQRSDKNKESLGYNAVPPLLKSIHILRKICLRRAYLNLLMILLLTILGKSSGSIMSKPMIKFVKAVDCPRVIKTNNTENVRKSTVKYAEMYRNTSKSPKVRGYWDSGCSRHMTGNISYLSEYEPYDGGYVSFGQGGGKITGKSIIKTGKLKFENVYFVKELKYNLFSVSQICDNKNNVLFIDSECIVLEKDFKLKDDTNVFLKTPTQHNIYSIDLNNIVPHKNLTCLVAKASVDKSMLWHRRLGHLNFKTMNKLVRNNLVKGLTSRCFENDHTCVACLKRKQHKASCKTKLVNSISKPLHTLHMDLFGPTSVSSLNHKWYCLVVTNDFSRFIWTFFLRTKDETSSILRNFITQIENLKDLKVKIIRCDNGGELKNKEMNELCAKKGLKESLAMLGPLNHLEKFDAKGDEGYFIGYSLSSKAFKVFNKRTKKVKENLHVDFLENKLIKKGAGPNWLFDIDTLTNSMNYVPVVVAGTSSTNISGTQDVVSQAVKKDVSSLRYIALLNWFHEAHMEKRNSDACNTDDPESSGISNPTATSKVPSAEQVEHVVSLTVETKISTVISHIPTVCLDISLESSSDPRIISKGYFSQKETPSLGNALTLSNRFEDTFGEEADLSNMESSIPISPTPTFRIHKDHPKSQILGPVDTPVQTRHKSKEMEEQSFMATNHQKTNPDLLQVRPIGTKWVLKNKKDERGIMIRNKARLVAQGYTQEEVIDYEEVFAPVARIEAIRLFLVYASFICFIVYQMNVKSAFLYGTINDEAPRAWYGTLSKYLLDNGFQRDVRLANTPMEKENPWGKDGIGKDVELHLYRSMIGSLMYLTTSRPYIMFAVCACARHQMTPKKCHLYVVKRIFRYLKGHPKLGLWYPKESPFDLVAYSNSDYGGATQDRKSTTRGCQFMEKIDLMAMKKADYCGHFHN
uniref:Putative ribonuclease H-like domain-containing protein n=1 Tax=Tanacetum cinerariifolium TaxID=118510 RepID=A0A6L2JI63_TANCI|nr:putative ribonuclease H-like domain-containing protein [Tanacetum cinerariifolium]